MSISQQLRSDLEELTTHYPQRRAALIPALHRCQEEMGGWLSPETLEDVAEFFDLEPVEVYGVASFYPMFHLKPVGRHVVGVCRNISCDLRGAPEIIEAVCRITGAQVGGTSADGNFTVEVLECQGACTNAPMMVVDGTYHENLDPQAVERILGAIE